MNKELIIVEGIDGTGKTSFIKKNFNKKMYKIIHLPGYYVYNKLFYFLFKKNLLKDYQYTFQLLSEHYQIMNQFFFSKQSFVLDRSFISFFVYQEEEIYNYNLSNTFNDFLYFLRTYINNNYKVKIFYFDKVFCKKEKDWLENKNKNLLLLRYNSILKQIKLCCDEVDIYFNGVLK